MKKRVLRGATECQNPICMNDSTMVLRAGNRLTYICNDHECEKVMTKIIQERRDRTQPLGNYLPKKRRRQRGKKSREFSRNLRYQKKQRG